MTYSRLQNPTVQMLEERIALMEGAEACRAQATGMAAMTTALLCQLQMGDHVVAARAACDLPRKFSLTTNERIVGISDAHGHRVLFFRQQSRERSALRGH
jgi:O-acetylhomoserine/O-acetylserine sulfhydrylase-like pyridoxal-dependent enzyme